MGAEFHGSMYQSGRSPSKKHRALPWGLSTTVACTRVVDYHPKIPCITVVSEYHGKCYQPQKSLPRRALDFSNKILFQTTDNDFKSWWYVCMVIMYGKGIDQPGKVANPARSQLNRENGYFPVPIRAWEFGLARRLRQSRPASDCSFSILRLHMVLTYEIPPISTATSIIFIILINTA